MYSGGHKTQLAGDSDALRLTPPRECASIMQMEANLEYFHWNPSTWEGDSESASFVSPAELSSQVRGK